MNILFFLTPKCEVAYIEDNDTLRQALEKMEHHRYTALPILRRDGSYFGTVTEGDLLWEIKNQLNLDLRAAEQICISDIQRNDFTQPVDIHATMEALMERAMSQNFVPVVDDEQRFIGIITRRELLNYLYRQLNRRDSAQTDEAQFGSSTQAADMKQLHASAQAAAQYASICPHILAQSPD